jgi:hypothetical protein
MESELQKESADIRVSLAIHELIRQYQNENGLKHHDHTRYRHFLTRKLQKVRKSAGLMYGKGKSYVKQDITEDMIHDSNSLLLVTLLLTERAWSTAAEKKDAFSKVSKMKIRHSELRKHAKAVIWANKLEELCLARGDPQTALEATAYASWMRGQNHLEREEWNVAVEMLTNAKSIYAELCKVGALDQQDLFSDRLSALEPSLRFCRYNLYGPGSENINDDTFEADADIMAKLNHIRAKQLSATDASDPSGSSSAGRIFWGDRYITPPTDELLAMCIQLKPLVDTLNSTSTTSSKHVSDSNNVLKQKEAMYEKILALIDTINSIATKETDKLVAGGGGKLGDVKASLSNLKNYLQYTRLACISHRLRYMIDQYEKSYVFDAHVKSVMTQSTKPVDITVKKGGNKNKIISPQDLTHLYEKLLNTTKEMITIPGILLHLCLCE